MVECFLELISEAWVRCRVGEKGGLVCQRKWEARELRLGRGLRMTDHRISSEKRVEPRHKGRGAS